MPIPRDPDDSYLMSEDELRRRAAANEMPPRSRFDDDLQPQMMQGTASAGRVAAYAIAALLIVFGVIYGISHSTTGPNTASAPIQTNSAANTPVGAPPAQRMMPNPNAKPGLTTGAAPAAPAPSPPQGNPPGTATKQ